MAPGAAEMVEQIVGAPRPAFETVATPRWVRVGSLAVYSPTLKWLYIATAINPAHQPEIRATVTRLRAAGFRVDWMGSELSMRNPFPATNNTP